MKKLVIVLSLMLLLTACGSTTDNDGKESELPATDIIESADTEKDTEVSADNTYEKIANEYTTSEGYRVIEYEDGYTTILSPEGTIAIVKTPKSDDYTEYFDYKLNELPKDDGTESSHDLRSKDISNIDLSNELDYLLTADFDDDTKWPGNIPKEYDIEKIKEYGMDPGLGIRKLHEKGITGKGVGIAIIDQSLLVNHLEYKDRIKLYEEIHINSDFAQMHGPAVASIAVGKNVGVAPEADLYYIAETHGVFKKDGFDWDLYWLAKSIDRIIEINKTLPIDKKIRVISISLGIDNPELKNVDLVQEAINRASNEGIYTIHVGASIMGVGRDPLGDPNDLNSYTKGYFWRDAEYRMVKDDILVPMDSRCIASPTGEDKYVFYYSGGMSWAVPYTAGIYALCCQENPNITPEEFNAALNKTTTEVRLGDSNDEYKILNPEALINEIKK
ncbi:S8 family serine peptidase [Clostridium sp. Cult3]|uniref:S8 family serine peptidase n=1 Tax=Clostridium sp. Cult3 TaxID=2079004 RepID=UPI001F00AB38|nr:S8 family serine peptidase [Clostridium sp. Cult3]MCF6461727.1 peptidase S8 [Clostridium sp. Cult3]